MPRMQALSSNQTLTQQDGVSSKERLPSSKVGTGRDRTGSPRRMNADLTMVNESSQGYYTFGHGNVQKVSQVIANVNAAGRASAVAIKDTKETMELDTH